MTRTNSSFAKPEFFFYPGRGDSHIRRTRFPLEIMKRSPERYQDLILWAWVAIFSLQEVLILKEHINLHSNNFFRMPSTRKVDYQIPPAGADPGISERGGGGGVVHYQ